MNRRKLFSFLAVSPLAAVGEIAKANQGTEIAVERIRVGDDFVIEATPEGSVKMSRPSQQGAYCGGGIEFLPVKK